MAQEQNTTDGKTLQQLNSSITVRRKERVNNGDVEGNIVGIKLNNEYEAAYEKATGKYPEKLENVAQHLADDWVQRVQTFLAEKTELDSADLLPMDRQVIQSIGLSEYRKIIQRAKLREFGL